jgi:hypothetical protein
MDRISKAPKRAGGPVRALHADERSEGRPTPSKRASGARTKPEGHPSPGAAPGPEAKALGSGACEACAELDRPIWWVARERGSEILCAACMRLRLAPAERAGLIARARWFLTRLRGRPRSILVAGGEVVGPLDVGDTSKD